MEFFENGGDASARLHWSSASQSDKAIPASRHDGARAGESAARRHAHRILLLPMRAEINRHDQQTNPDRAEDNHGDRPKTGRPPSMDHRNHRRLLFAEIVDFLQPHRNCAIDSGSGEDDRPVTLPTNQFGIVGQCHKTICEAPELFEVDGVIVVGEFSFGNSTMTVVVRTPLADLECSCVIHRQHLTWTTRPHT